MVWGKEAPPAPAWAVALEAKPRQTINMHIARILGEVVIQISEGLRFVLNAYIAHILHRLETSHSRDETLVEPHNHRTGLGFLCVKFEALSALPSFGEEILPVVVAT
jgi:hypothetical protein